MPNQFTASLWGDEGFSAILSMKPLPEIIRIIINDTSPPLWNIFEWLVFNTLGTDEIYIRLLAFTFFLGAVFFTYKIGKHLFNKTTAALAAALIFLNPFFFIYAFEGRMYSILALGVTASMYYFLKRRWVPYIFWTLWAMYSHHFAMFALTIQGLWLLKELIAGERKLATDMLKAFVVVGIFYLPWIYPLYLQTSKVGGGFWLATPDLTDLRVIIYDYLAKGIQHGLATPALYLVAAALFVRRWNRRVGKTIFLLSWFLGPIVLTWIVSQFFASIFFNRYLLYSIPPAMLIVASNRRRGVSKLLIGAVLLVFLLIDFHYFTNPTKIPFRDLAAYVNETRTDGDYLINEDPGNHKLWESKYYGIPAPIYVPSGDQLPFFVGTALMEEGDIIIELPEGINRLGVITLQPLEDLDFPRYTGSEGKSFGDLNFVWLHSKN